MFAFTTVKTLVESQLDAEHPLRGIRATMRQVLAEGLPSVRVPSGQRPPQISRDDFLRASVWRALYSLRNDRLLKQSLRFDLRAQWFVGFCLHPHEWSHSAYGDALDAYLLHASAQLFFTKMLTYLKEQGLHRSPELALNLELLEGWADPSCLMPSDGVELAAARGALPVARDWSQFEGRRAQRSLPSTAYRPGCRPTSQLGGQVSTTRALANAQLGPLTLKELEETGAMPATASRVPALSPPTPPKAKKEDTYDPKSLMQSLMQEILG